MRYGAMHYQKRRVSKVVTPKYEIDYRLLDLLDLTSRRKKISKNKLFEMAILELCRSASLKFYFKSKRKKKFMAYQTTLDLLDSTSKALRVSKNEIVNKSLKNYLSKEFI